MAQFFKHGGRTSGFLEVLEDLLKMTEIIPLFIDTGGIRSLEAFRLLYIQSTAKETLVFVFCVDDGQLEFSKHKFEICSSFTFRCTNSIIISSYWKQTKIR